MFQHFMALTLAISLAGCSGQPNGDPVATAPAGGRLTLNGEPLESYQVVVFPNDSVPAIGTTDADGRFVLGTNKPGDGAIVGSHKVAVMFMGPPSIDPSTDPETDPNSDSDKGTETDPNSDPDKGTETDPNSDPAEGTTELTSPRSNRGKIDAKYLNPETSGLRVDISASGSTELVIDLQ